MAAPKKTKQLVDSQWNEIAALAAEAAASAAGATAILSRSDRARHDTRIHVRRTEGLIRRG